MAKRSDVVKIAKKELDIGVSGRPNKYTKWYGSNGEWCAMFVSYVFNKAGVSTSIVPRTAEVQVLYNFAQNKGRFKSKNSGYVPQAGDIMIQKSNSASHTGVVIESSGRNFTTIEGNSGDAVRKCSYNLSSLSLTGFFVPAYDGKDSEFNEDNGSVSEGDVSLCSTRVVSTVNIGEETKERSYVNIKSQNGRECELHIINKGVDYVPIVIGEVQWKTEWCDTPGTLEFTVLKDKNIDIEEGNVVIFKMGVYNIFYGYLFKKNRNKNGTIKCTAYDQLRYFKNVDTFCYKNKTYSDLLKYLAMEYKLIYSKNMTETKYIIDYAIEDNVSIFEMLKNARKRTALETGKLYILFDDFGSLTLKDVEQLKTNYLLTEKNFEDFEYETSIDDGVYNRIQFYKDDKSTGNREKYIYEDGTNINKWGVLQQTIDINDSELSQPLGKYILDINNQKKISLSIKNCFGDVNLRAGASLFVSLDVGDVIYNNSLFFITKATHKFSKSYKCDLEIVGQNRFVGEI